jgi:hypothetical protein
VLPQERGFLALENTGYFAGYRLDVLAPDGSLDSRRRLSDLGEALVERDPLGGALILEMPADVHEPPSLEAVDAAGATRWRATLPFTHVEVFGVDRQGHTLVLSASGGSLDGAWVDHAGTVHDVFRAENGSALVERVLAPRAGGGLFLRSDGAWMRSFEPLGTGGDVPGWLADRPDTELFIARGGQAYAVLPLPAGGGPCAQRLELVAPDGTVCGSASLGWAGTCETRAMAVGWDGTLIQRVPEDHETCVSPGHCSCEWRWWSRLLAR